MTAFELFARQPPEYRPAVLGTAPRAGCSAALTPALSQRQREQKDGPLPPGEGRVRANRSVLNEQE